MIRRDFIQAATVAPLLGLVGSPTPAAVKGVPEVYVVQRWVNEAFHERLGDDWMGFTSIRFIDDGEVPLSCMRVFSCKPDDLKQIVTRMSGAMGGSIRAIIFLERNKTPVRPIELALLRSTRLVPKVKSVSLGDDGLVHISMKHDWGISRQ